jgi:hypothetical protein
LLCTALDLRNSRADVLARIADLRNVDLEALLPWNWNPQSLPGENAAA